MNLKELKEKKITELSAIAKELVVEGAAGMRKQDLILAVLNATSEKNGAIFGEGVIIDSEGHGAQARVQVQFAACGVKWLVLAYAGLKIL